MKIYTIQWRDEGDLMATEIKASSLFEAKQEISKKYGVKPSMILKSDAWR